jgi:hypothetical protein
MANRRIGMVEVSRDGFPYYGVWALYGNTITVTWCTRQKAAAVNGSVNIPEGLACALLDELINEHRAAQCLPF